MARTQTAQTSPPPAPGATEERARSKEIGGLQALWPFMAPYRGLIIASGLALVLTACVSLTLPLAVRRVIDDMHHWYHRKPIRHKSTAGQVSAVHVHDSIVVLEKSEVTAPSHSRISR